VKKAYTYVHTILYILGKFYNEIGHNEMEKINEAIVNTGNEEDLTW
jgi:hypothetical protein